MRLLILIIVLVIIFVALSYTALSSVEDEMLEDLGLYDYEDEKNPYMVKNTIFPLTGALGGQSDFDDHRNPAHHMMRSHLMSKGNRHLFMPEEEMKSREAERMAKHNYHLFGSHNQRDSVWDDKSPWASLTEVAEYKPSISIASNDPVAFQRFERFRRMKGGDFDETTMYEQDQSELGEEFQSVHALYGQAPRPKHSLIHY